MFLFLLRSCLQLFGRVILLDLPLDPRVVLVTLFDRDLLLVFADRQAILTAAVLHEIRLSQTTINDNKC